MEKSTGDRVFHLDDECYVIYIGTDIDDYRPFLRIGTSSDLPERLRPFISWVIVSDDFTGDVFHEHENLQLPLDGETKYTGDAELVARLKQFLHEKDLPAADVVFEVDEDKDVKGSFVYFHHDGNLHVSYNTKKLFDLREREERDVHFVYRAERAARAVRDNPLRLPRTAFAGSGFVRCRDRLYAFSGGRLGSVGISPDYPIELARSGIDPDMYGWAAAEELSTGVLHRLKRGVVKKQSFTLVTRGPEAFQTAVHLFAGRGASCALQPVREDTLQPLAGFGAGPAENGLRLSWEGRPFLECRYDGSWRLETSLLPAGAEPIEGVPYSFEKAVPAFSRIGERYLRDVAEKTAPCMDEPATLDRFLRAVRSYRMPDGSREEEEILDLFNSLSWNAETAYYLAWNIREVCRFRRSELGAPPRLLRVLERVEKSYTEFLEAARPPEFWPMGGEVYTGGRSRYLFYLAHALCSKQRVLQARRGRESLEKLRVQDRSAFYASECERLDLLIQSLTVPRLRKRIRPRPEPPAVVADAAATAGEGGRATPSAQAASPPARAASSYTGPAVRGSAGASESRKKARRLMAAALVLALLSSMLAVALVFRPFAYRHIPPGGGQAPGVQAPVAADQPRRPETAVEPPPAATEPAAPLARPLPDDERRRDEALDTPIARAERADVDPAALEITVLDIFILVNRIAIRNGFLPLTDLSQIGRGRDRRDPNWIYPGNRFVLPDETVHTVVPEDTLWDIASAYIRGKHALQFAEYLEASRRYKDDLTALARRYEELAAATHSENFRRFLREKAAQVKEE